MVFSKGISCKALAIFITMCFIDLERRIFSKMDAILIANDSIIIAHCGISGGMVGNVSCQLKASRLSQENDSISIT